MTKILCACLILLASFPVLMAQDRAFRINIQACPVISWVSNDEAGIESTDGNFGFKLGATGEASLNDLFSFTFGIHLSLHQGGEFLYHTGGNYLPQSILSDPLLNTGNKPMPDGVRIRYNLQYLECPVSLKLKSGYKRDLRFFAEAPVITFAYLTRGRGDITSYETSLTGENISPDLAHINAFIGFGGGLEYAFSAQNAFTFGIYYNRGLLDFTKNSGYRAVPNPNEDPNDPIDDYYRYPDKSRAILSNLTFRIGLNF